MEIVDTEGIDAADALSRGGVKATYEKGTEDFLQIISSTDTCKFFKKFTEQVWVIIQSTICLLSYGSDFSMLCHRNFASKF